MRLQVMIVGASALLSAGSALAGERGMWAPGLSKPREVERQRFAPATPAYEPSQTTSRYRNAGTPPEAPGFKPYQGQSVYSHPNGYGASHGARDCELSVYMNACGQRRRY